MQYTIIVKGRSYDLPKKTIMVMEDVDTVLKVDSIVGLTVRQKYEKLHVFMKNLVGSDGCQEMFGTDNLSEIDLSDLTIAVKMVVDAYDKPVVEYEMEKSRRKLDNLPFEKITSIANAAQSISNAGAMKKQ